MSLHVVGPDEDLGEAILAAVRRAQAPQGGPELEPPSSSSSVFLDTALRAIDLGFSTVPPMEDGSKRPIAKWKEYQQQPATRQQVTDWYRAGLTGVGLVCGYGSLECFEFDDADIYREFKRAAAELGLDELVERIEAGYVETSPGGGIHWLYKCEVVSGNTKLAERPDPTGATKREPLIETRGQGGFVIIAPSNGKVHPTGGAYNLMRGGLESIATISVEEREALFTLARSFDEMPEQAVGEPVQKQGRSFKATASGSDVGGKKPGEDFAERTSWEEILEPHGWVKVFSGKHGTYWRRPGKDKGWSATTGHCKGLKVFSTSTAFSTQGTCTKFGAYAVLNCQRDVKAAAKALAEKGFGTWIDEKGEEHHNPRPKGSRSSRRTATPCPQGSGNCPPRELPEILITTKENEVNNQAIAALANDQNIYRLGYVLATVVEEPLPPRGVTYVDGPPPHISPLEPATLRERMAGAALWLVSKQKGQEWEEIPVHPPDWSVAAVHKRMVYPGIRPIVGVIEAPTMRQDGSILFSPGYDPVTRLYLKPNVVVPPIADRPSLSDAEQALAEIYDLVTDFPFKSDERKAVWLASLFTVVARASFAGPAPLFAFDGNVPGSGKSKLADLVAVIATGRRMPRSIWPSGRHADDETRKRHHRDGARRGTVHTSG